MKHKNIPAHIDKLLKQRAELASDLMGVAAEIDRYCEKIGVDMTDSTNNSVLTDCTIYCEPDTAYINTKRAIENALNKER